LKECPVTQFWLRFKAGCDENDRNVGNYACNGSGDTPFAIAELPPHFHQYTGQSDRDGESDEESERVHQTIHTAASRTTAIHGRPQKDFDFKAHVVRRSGSRLCSASLANLPQQPN
jgi:hypothetical protein